MDELRVGIRDLKANLSAYLRKVRSGQSIMITDHGKEVGRILPITDDLDTQINYLKNAGLLNWNGKRLSPMSKPWVNTSKLLISDLLLEMRE